MGYLKFDRNNMSNLEVSLSKEILRTNRRGAYHASSIVGCNTRKYHGLLVVPSPFMDGHGNVLLSSFDETVIQHGAEFNLAVHKYKDGTVAPNGHKYIREFDIDIIPKTLYRVGGVVLSKEIIFSRGTNRVLIRYTLLDAHSPTILRFRPILAFRNVKELTTENDAINWDYQTVENGISMCLYEGYPELYMQFSTPVEWHHVPIWYKDFFYEKEQERGHACVEDLPTPGYFECNIRKGESVIFVAGDEPTDPTELHDIFEKNIQARIPRNSFTNCLINSADQFYLKKGEGQCYLLSGYPWFGVKARDQFMNLTACTFGIGKPDRFDEIFETAWPALVHFMGTGEGDDTIRGIQHPDTLLWVITSMQDYSKWRSLDETREKYGAYLKTIINYLTDGHHPTMKKMENGLLYVIPKDGMPVTWMDGKIYGVSVVDRQGYIVEINALWYNALCFYQELAGEKDEALSHLIEKVAESFVRVFVNEHNYLFDYVCEGRSQDWNVRPNMIFAAGLPYSPLSRDLQRSVLDIVTKELLTPKGLRTLSPKSPYYRGYCNGTLHEREYASNQGAVWPWLMYPYLSAYLKLFKLSGVSFVERVLISFEDELTLHGIGTLSEMYDATPPFVGRGGISYAGSIAAILRIQNRLNDFYQENEAIETYYSKQ